MKENPIWTYIVLAAGIVVFYLIGRLRNRKSRYLKKHGILAKATIMSINKTNVEYGFDAAARPLMQVKLEVHSSLATQASVKQAFGFMQTPQPGDEVHVLIDPKDTSRMMIVDSAGNKL